MYSNYYLVYFAFSVDVSNVNPVYWANTVYCSLPGFDGDIWDHSQKVHVVLVGETAMVSQNIVRTQRPLTFRDLITLVLFRNVLIT